MEIKDAIAVITGGGSGLGAATAQLLYSLGARIALLDIHQDNLSQIVPAPHSLAIACDVTNPDSLAAALAQIKAQLGTPRICVNCAGIAPAKRILGKEGVLPLEEFKHVIDVNLTGTFNVMRLVAEAMASLEPVNSEEQERGVIINTASIAAYEGQIGQAAYSASKGAVAALTLPAARELAQYGIRVMTIAPGLFATPLLLAMPQAIQDSLGSMTPFPKRFGKPDEFAALVRHIIENTMLNGEVIRLDGALRMQPK